jgi:hypothetical protein
MEPIVDKKNIQYWKDLSRSPHSVYTHTSQSEIKLSSLVPFQNTSDAFLNCLVIEKGRTIEYNIMNTDLRVTNDDLLRLFCALNE